jgi:uncharacterized membrane protein
MNKNRLEAFSDGVIAILITIMVLELKVPHGIRWSEVSDVVPTLLSYVLSFVFLAIYWVNHHHLVHTIQHVNGKILWANLHLLFWLSLIPFVTSWMGSSNFDQVAVAVYGVLALMCGASYSILSRTIARSRSAETKLTAALESSKRKENASIVLYTASIPMAFVSPWLSCLLFATVSIMWIVPNRAIEKALGE